MSIVDEVIAAMNKPKRSIPMDRWGPSEECERCGRTKNFGEPCECDELEMNWQKEQQEKQDEDN